MKTIWRVGGSLIFSGIVENRTRNSRSIYFFRQKKIRKGREIYKTKWEEKIKEKKKCKLRNKSLYKFN